MKLLWLSHMLEPSTPLYGGAKDFAIRSVRAIEAGDSANTSMIVLPSHAGTHVDAPYHFVPGGKAVEDYPPETWVFREVVVLNVPAVPGRLIEPEELLLDGEADLSADLVLIKTGFEAHRDSDLYWRDSPGLSPGMAAGIRNVFPRVRAIGIDFISISSLRHREEGRAAHAAFLQQDILLFEDVSLKGVERNVAQVVAVPLRFRRADGSPCTILAWIDE